MKIEQKITIEGLRCGPFAPLDKETGQLLVRLLQASLTGADKGMLEKALEQDVGCKIIENRLTNQGGQAGPSAILMASVLSAGIPGRMVMWAYTLYREFREKGDPATLESLCYTFPEGFPTAEAYQDMWDSQKGHTHEVKADNLLDCRSWEDLLPTPSDG